MSTGRKLVFAAVPVTAVLMLGEVGARVLGAEDCAPITPEATGWETMVGDARYLWRLEPGRAFAVPGGTTMINEIGLRTEVLPTTPKAPGELRVVLTGDSSIFGWGQPDGMSYADQLERELQASFQGAATITVVNLGVPGYSTEQTLRLLEDVGWSYAPDLLVVHNIFSDCNIDAFQDRAALALADPDGTATQRVLHGSRLYCAVRMPWARFQATLNQEPNRVLMPGMPTGPNAATTLEQIDQVIDLSRVPLPDYLDNLDTIRTEAEARGAAMILAPLAQEWDVGVWTMPMAEPTPDQVLPWHPYREAQAEWAASRGIGRVYLPDAFAAAATDGGTQGGALFIDQMHPSVRGAQVMAWAVTDHLRAHPELIGLTAGDVQPLAARVPVQNPGMGAGRGPGGGSTGGQPLGQPRDRRDGPGQVAPGEGPKGPPLQPPTQGPPGPPPAGG